MVTAFLRTKKKDQYLEFAASQNHIESIEFLAPSYIWATATILPRNKSKGVGLLRKAVQSTVWMQKFF